MKRFSSLMLVALMVSGCVSSRVAMKESFRFENIKSIGILTFDSQQVASNAGTLVAAEFSRQLLARGINVKMLARGTNQDLKALAEREGVDVFLTGQIITLTPDKKFLIRLDHDEGDSASRDLIVLDPVVELGGSSAYSQGTAFGIGDHSKIIVTSATVGISAQLVDSSEGSIVWAHSYTYEGLDTQAALEGAVRFLVRSLPQ